MSNPQYAQQPDQSPSEYELDAGVPSSSSRAAHCPER